MSDLTAERDALVARARDVILGKIVGTGHKSAEINADLDALLSAHRSALAGETEQETMEKAVAQTKGMEAPEEHNCTSRDIDVEIDGCAVGQECDGYWEAWFRARLEAAARILTAPLLARLQEREERIKVYRARLMTLMDIAQEASGDKQSYDFRARAHTNARLAELLLKEAP